MADSRQLGDRIEAALAVLEQDREKARAEETRKYQEWQQRVERLNKVFDSLREVWKPPLEVLMAKFGDRVKATPKLMPSTRDIELQFQSDVARIRLRFRATTDDDIRKLILNYDLEIIPILMQFESHSELEMPLDAVDRDAVARWIDDRILSFVTTYVKAHQNKNYLNERPDQGAAHRR